MISLSTAATGGWEERGCLRLAVRAVCAPGPGRGRGGVVSLALAAHWWSREGREAALTCRCRLGDPGGAIRGSVAGRRGAMAMAPEEIAARVRSRSGRVRVPPICAFCSRTRAHRRYARDGPRGPELARQSPALGRRVREISEAAEQLRARWSPPTDSRRSQPFAGRGRDGGARYEARVPIVSRSSPAPAARIRPGRWKAGGLEEGTAG